MGEEGHHQWRGGGGGGINMLSCFMGDQVNVTVSQQKSSPTQALGPVPRRKSLKFPKHKLSLGIFVNVIHFDEE